MQRSLLCLLRIPLHRHSHTQWQMCIDAMGKSINDYGAIFSTEYIEQMQFYKYQSNSK